MSISSPSKAMAILAAKLVSRDFVLADETTIPTVITEAIGERPAIVFSSVVTAMGCSAVGAWAWAHGDAAIAMMSATTVAMLLFAAYKTNITQQDYKTLSSAAEAAAMVIDGNPVRAQKNLMRQVVRTYNQKKAIKVS